ncbi:MAG: YceD family protein [Solirubrobacteraceae bacterium]
MAPRADSLDLAALRLATGEGRRIELGLVLDPFELGGERYVVTPAQVDATLDVSKTTGAGYALRLHFQARVVGPCMRCLEPAEPRIDVDAREVSQPGSGDELQSPYVVGGVLDLSGWGRDALALTLPNQILCRFDCAGLCGLCGANLNEAGSDHDHEQAPDPRWAKLAELKFEQ